MSHKNWRWKCSRDRCGAEKERKVTIQTGVAGLNTHINVGREGRHQTAMANMSRMSNMYFVRRMEI